MEDRPPDLVLDAVDLETADRSVRVADPDLDAETVAAQLRPPRLPVPIRDTEQLEPEGVLVKGDLVVNRDRAIDAVLRGHERGGDRLRDEEATVGLNDDVGVEVVDVPVRLRGGRRRA